MFSYGEWVQYLKILYDNINGEINTIIPATMLALTEPSVMNVNSIEDWIELTGNSATYTLSYLQELNVLVILDRCDGNSLNVPVRIVNLEDGTLHTIATLETASGNSETIGFRTTYADVYALNSINVGFGFKSTNSATNVNLIKGFGNAGTSGNPSANINNLVLKVAKISNGYKLLLDTHYI